MPCESSSLNSTSGMVMIVPLKMTHISSEHYTTEIFSNVYSSFCHISDLRNTSNLNQCTLQTLTISDYTVRWTQAIGGERCKISFLPVRQLCQLFGHLGRLMWPMVRPISMSGRCISQLGIFEMISAIHRNSMPVVLLGWSPVPQMLPKILTRYGILWLEPCSPPIPNYDIAGPGLKWNCADGFQRQYYPLLAVCVGDYPEQVVIAQVSYGACPMFEIPKGALMGHSTIRPLDNPGDQDVYSELLDETNIDVLHTPGVHPICNLFWQYPLCNVYHLWQPDELHQLLLNLVKDRLHWLLKYLKAQNVMDQFDNRFTSVPRYPGLQPFTKPFDWMKSSSWQEK